MEDAEKRGGARSVPSVIDMFRGARSVTSVIDMFRSNIYASVDSEEHVQEAQGRYIYITIYINTQQDMYSQEEIATSILGAFSSFNIYRPQKKCFRYQSLRQKNFECRNKHN